MKLKKLLSLALTGALALSMASTALASKSTELTGGYIAPTIDVSVPTNGSIGINPYAINYQIPDTQVKIYNQQVVTEPLIMKNNSDMDLNVTAKALATLPTDSEGTVTSGIKLVAAENLVDPAEATAKNVFMALQATVAYGVTYDTTADTINTKYATWASGALNYNASTDLVIGTKEASKANMVMLKSAIYDVENDATRCVDGGAAFLRIAGKVKEDPKVAWSDGDTLTVTLTFTFKPTASAADLRLNKTEVTAAAGDTITISSALFGGLTGGTYAWADGSGDVTLSAGAFSSTDKSYVTVTVPSGTAGQKVKAKLTWTSDDATPVEKTATCTITLE